MFNDQGYMWKVLESAKRQGIQPKPYKLSRGDILKLGRYIFEVKDISSKSDNANQNQSLDNTEIDYRLGMKNERSNSIIPRTTTLHTAIDYNTIDKGLDSARGRPLGANVSGSQTSKDGVWRICLSDEAEDGNPLISPCKWSGTMKYIHLNWLKEWLSSKKSEKKGIYFSSYLWENVFWELCKDNFTENVTTQFGVVNILGIETPKSGNYLLLEALNSGDILKKNTKIVHIIDFKKLKELSVGRGHDNKVRITDISISRLHWKFLSIKKEIYIDDHGSKFGTLVAIKTPLNLNKCEFNTRIQVGHTLLILSVNRPCKCFCKLFRPSNLTEGISYFANQDAFGSAFRKLWKDSYTKNNNHRKLLEEKEMYSQINLLQK